jgi:hypothetical protein
MDSISGKNAVGQVMLIAKSSQEGLKDGWTRATFILRKDHLEKIKALSYWKRRNIKEVLDEILEGYLKGKRIKLLRSESK